MELAIPSNSVKEFTAILKSFKSFADFIHVHPLPTRLKFSAVSPTRSTYAVAIFERSFFHSYLLSNPTLGLIEVALKPFHKIFAQSNLIAPLDSCKITIDLDDSNEPLSNPRRPSGLNPGGQTGGAHRLNHRLTIKLKSTVGILRSFSLPYAASRTLNPTDLRANNSPNRWVCLSSNLKQWLDHFITNPNITQNLVGALDGIEDICFCYLPDRQIVLKTVNLADDSNQNAIVPRKQDIFTKGVRQLSTSLTVSWADFEKFEVEGARGTIMTTMSQKEVRSIFELGNVMGSAVDAGFSEGGRPVYFSLLNPEGSVGLEFVLASTHGEQLGPSNDAAGPRPPERPGLPPQKPRPVTPASSRVDSSSARSSHPAAQHHLLASMQKGKERATPASSRVDSSAHPSPRRPPHPAAQNPMGLFKPPDSPHDNEADKQQQEEEEEDDELDRMPAATWDHVEQQAMALSQSRKRQRLSHSASTSIDHNGNGDNNNDDDEQLLPSQVPGNPNEQPHWKLFFD